MLFKLNRLGGLLTHGESWMCCAWRCLPSQGAAEALEQFPAVNGVIEGENILYRDYCDISIAVGTPKGLVVPVLRSVDKMGFADIEKVRVVL